MTSHRTARAAVSSAVVLVVAAATTLTLTALVPDGTSWSDAPVLAATAEPTDRSTHVSRSTGRGPALPVALVVDGVERAVVTTAPDVTALLVEQDVVLGDRAVSHDLDAPVVSGMRVEVVDVTWTHETTEVDVEPEIEEIEDATLALGTRRVVSAGTAGRSVTTYLVASVDGIESSRSEVVSVVLREPVAGRVRVGTGVAPSASPTPPARPGEGPSAEPTSPVTSAPAPDDGAGSGDETATPEPTPTPTPTPSATPSATPEPKPSAKPEPKPQPTTAPPGTDGTTPASAKAIAKRKVAARGWDSSEYRCLVTLWERESNWSYTAANPSSTARGIPQALMSVHFGADWRTSEAGKRYLTTPSVQIDWGLRYIAGRYDGPCGALAHSDKRGWY